MIRVFTSAAINYLPKAKLMAHTLKKYHPEMAVYLILVDEKPSWLNNSIDPFELVITAEELDIPNFKSWIFRYSLVEMSTGVKPFALRRLLNVEDTHAVLYFDPDIAFFSRIDDLIAEFERYSILLTPHQTLPEKSLEAVIDNELCSLRHGVYNLGFIGVRNDTIGRNFADWWCDRLCFFCLGEIERGLWVDQKWIDLVPALFDKVKIIRDSRFNVATWNVTTRDLRGSFEDGFTVDGKPLAFYHFTGFDSGAHEIMAAKYAAKNKAVKELIAWYKKATSDKNISRHRWTYSRYNRFDNGEPITEAHRKVYRWRFDLQKAFPDPFRSDSKHSYYWWFKTRAWIEEPDICSPQISGVKRKFRRRLARIMKIVKEALSDRRYFFSLCGIALSIWRREGLKGLMKHLFEA
ncbi:MAG: glycosyl transferase [Deltaproteobacteria bacterium]|nr:MAG: glycosyl transferase [Deltaproteobacteria bacterium]